MWNDCTALIDDNDDRIFLGTSLFWEVMDHNKPDETEFNTLRHMSNELRSDLEILKKVKKLIDSEKDELKLLSNEQLDAKIAQFIETWGGDPRFEFKAHSVSDYLQEMNNNIDVLL